jgi:hypothetical protein
MAAALPRRTLEKNYMAPVPPSFYGTGPWLIAPGKHKIFKQQSMNTRLRFHILVPNLILLSRLRHVASLIGWSSDLRTAKGVFF